MCIRDRVDTAKDEGTVFLSKIPGEPVCKGMGVVAHRRMDRKIGWFVDHHEVFKMCIRDRRYSQRSAD